MFYPQFILGCLWCVDLSDHACVWGIGIAVPCCACTVLLRFSMWLMLYCFLWMLCLLYFMFLCSCSFWPLRLLPGRIACWRMNLLREDIVCFVLSISLYGIFRVFKNGPHIREFYSRGFFLSQEVHYIWRYILTLIKRSGSFFLHKVLDMFKW